MDPVNLVKEYNISNQLDQIKVDAENIRFGDTYLFPKHTRTGYVYNGKPLTLEHIVYILNTKSMNPIEYVQHTTRDKSTRKFHMLGPDRTALLDYLDGRRQAEFDYDAEYLDRVAYGIQDIDDPDVKRAKLEGGLCSRQLRDRNSMLQAPAKDFKHVLDIANKFHINIASQLKQEAARLQKAAEVAKEPARPQAKPAAPGTQKPTHRTERDTTTDQLRAFGGAAAASMAGMVNMYGPSIPGSSSQPQAPSHKDPSSAARPTNGHHDQRAARPSSSSRPQHAQHSSQHRSSQHVSGSRQHDASQRPSSGGVRPDAKSSAPPSAAGGVPSSSSRDPARGQMPIILVPSGMTAMINMNNAVSFLAQGRFQPNQATAQDKPAQITFERTAYRPKPVKYVVTDQAPDKQDAAAWARVVAVIVSGQKWQFRDWPHKGADKGDMAEAFSKVAGFYVHYADDKVSDTVANWNVKRIGLTREKRHMDAPLMLDFYKHLDNFLLARRSSLAY